MGAAATNRATNSDAKSLTSSDHRPLHKLHLLGAMGRATIMAVAVLAQRQQKRRVKLRLLLFIRAKMMVHERNYLVKSSLLCPSHSSWIKLYESGFISTISLPPASFDALLAAFSRHYTNRSGVGRPGRPSAFGSKHAVLACILHFYTAAVENKTLSELFGVAPSTLSRTITKAEAALDAALQDLPDAKIKFPTKSEQLRWAVLTNAREPLVLGVWGFVDGKNYRMQSPSDADLQNANCNGWLHAVLVTGTLCFGVDGTIVWGRHNCPGSWNDGETNRALQTKMQDERKTVAGTGLAADSAFPVMIGAVGKIVTPKKEGDLDRAPEAYHLGMEAMSNAITSLRQAAEWGMGSPSRCYRQLLLPLPYNPHVRGQRLRKIFRMYNFRTRQTGISQIRTVFEA